MVFSNQRMNLAVYTQDHLANEVCEEQGPVAEYLHQNDLLNRLSHSSSLSKGRVNATYVCISVKNEGACQRS